MDLAGLSAVEDLLIPGLNRVALCDTQRKRDALLRTLVGEPPVRWRSSPVKVTGDRTAGAVPRRGQAAQPLRARETSPLAGETSEVRAVPAPPKPECLQLLRAEGFPTASLAAAR
jgi:hypothetical protein